MVIGVILWELVYDGTLLMAMWIKRFKTVWAHTLDVYDDLHVQKRFVQLTVETFEQPGRLLS